MGRDWQPRFACPDCGAAVPMELDLPPNCDRCEIEFGCRDGIFRFITPERQRRSEAMVRQYREVRAREGYVGHPGAYYRALPSVPAGDPHAAEWRVRGESFDRLRRFALPPDGSPIRILDLGAGNGWLSHRLATLGHHVVAVDLLADDDDGLGACRHYTTPFMRVHADFDALPFLPGQFDLVVFNGSLHYAPDVSATLTRARRMLAADGTLAVMDSPMFRHDEDGHAMVASKLRRFRIEYGMPEIVHPNVGFLTPASLGGAAARLGLCGCFVQSRGPLRWRLGRELARVRLRRAPAAFGVWIARPAQGEDR
jgi:SAM-dependent methyltransferase